MEHGITVTKPMDIHEEDMRCVYALMPQEIPAVLDLVLGAELHRILRVDAVWEAEARDLGALVRELVEPKQRHRPLG